MSKTLVQTAFGGFAPSSKLHEQGLALTGAMPAGHHFEQDLWNVIRWKRVQGRTRELNLNFAVLRNPELRNAAKVYVLFYRVTRNLAGAGALAILSSLKALDQSIPENLPLTGLKNKHFHEAADWLTTQAPQGSPTPAHHAGHLTRFGRFLNRQAGTRISFISSITAQAKHGSAGTPEGREERLIPLEVLRDVLALASSEQLHLKDRFFLQTLLLFVATGFRLSELFTLPADCLFEQNDIVGLRYFSVKKGKFEVKPVAAAFAPAVRAAVKWLQDATAAGRAAAMKARQAAPTETLQYDWSYIFRNDEAVRYFIGRQLHVYTADPRNNLFNPSGAWFERDKAYVDVLAMVRHANGNRNAVARQLKTGFQVVNYLIWAQEAMLRGELPPNSQRRNVKVNHSADSRFISHSTLERVAGIKIKDKREAKLRPWLKEAQRLQLLGESYPEPPLDSELEQRYATQQQAVIAGADGKPLLWPHEALFVIEPHTLSYGKQPQKGRYAVIPGNTMVRWLGGEAKAEGTGGVTEALFARFKIRDPRTGEIADFTSHQVRHWLNTMYLKGGLTNVEAALVMGHDPTTNAVYDQRDFLEREAALKQAVRANQAVGHISDVFLALVVEDAERAEEYLASTLRRYTVMPHGACTRDLRQDPCLNQLACFADQARDDGGACQYLIVDRHFPGIVSHLKELEQQQDMMLTILPALSPQHVHAGRTKKNVRFFLNALDKMEVEFIN